MVHPIPTSPFIQWNDFYTCIYSHLQITRSVVNYIGILLLGNQGICEYIAVHKNLNGGLFHGLVDIIYVASLRIHNSLGCKQPLRPGC